VVDIPLEIIADRFQWNTDLIIEQVRAQNCKIVFICSPANPTGQVLPAQQLLQLLQSLQGQCVVVIDEAYAEYSQGNSALELMQQFPHLVVLNTLSKAHALAGARIGCVIANPELIAVLKACQAPYPISKPSAELALHAFSVDALHSTKQHIDEALTQRQLMIEKLSALSNVLRVYHTDANFILVQFRQPERTYQALIEQGILIRSMAHYPAIKDCLRISIGTPTENNALLRILEMSL
jgi:histidinol-phosphate aminotransferase